MSITNLITKTLISGAIVLGSWVMGAAPAIADANTTDTSPFSGLHCDCQPAPTEGPARQAIDRGLREGLAASLPGLPAPTNRPR